MLSMGGVEAGELVIISPLERSQISLKFKVLDANDPTKILIEPPKPKEVKEKKKEEPEKRGWFGRKDKKDDSQKDDAEKPLKKNEDEEVNAVVKSEGDTP